MKPSIGWALFVAVLIGIAYFMVFSGRSAAAPAELLPLEVTKADFDDNGSCFPLSSLLSANGFDGSDSKVDTAWTERVKDEWTLRVERGSSWSAYTFQREGNRLLPVRTAFSDDLPQLSPGEAMTVLVVPAISQNKPRMPHCGAQPKSPFD